MGYTYQTRDISMQTLNKLSLEIKSKISIFTKDKGRKKSKK